MRTTRNRERAIRRRWGRCVSNVRHKKLPGVIRAAVRPSFVPPPLHPTFPPSVAPPPYLTSDRLLSPLLASQEREPHGPRLSEPRCDDGGDRDGIVVVAIGGSSAGSTLGVLGAADATGDVALVAPPERRQRHGLPQKRALGVVARRELKQRRVRQRAPRDDALRRRDGSCATAIVTAAARAGGGRVARANVVADAAREKAALAAAAVPPAPAAAAADFLAHRVISVIGGGGARGTTAACDRVMEESLPRDGVELGAVLLRMPRVLKVGCCGRRTRGPGRQLLHVGATRWAP